MKAIADEKLAKYVEEKLKQIDEQTLKLGAAVQQSLICLENVVDYQIELKRALREGIYQPSLWPMYDRPSPIGKPID